MSQDGKMPGAVPLSTVCLVEEPDEGFYFLSGWRWVKAPPRDGAVVVDCFVGLSAVVEDEPEANA